jgi:prepilin-type N-terminal cleavage/methylation domain-containing protein
MIREPSSQGGFTLLELLITITIATIILSAVSASWQSVIENTAGKRAHSNLVQAFADARSVAVTSNVTTTLCPLDAELKCISDWDGPISVFKDPNNDRRITPATELVQTHHRASIGILTASHSGPAERRYFQYNPDGSARGTIGNIVWCPDSAEASRAIQLRMNFGGRITWALDRDGDGVREDSKGQPLVCG